MTENNQNNNRITATKFLLINWSRFQYITFEMSGSTLLTGVNGTGKSTILDAMSYLICGNTKFNQAARDKDRGVKAYVRGDTQSNGEYRYLRKGDVTSYIAMELYNPIENKPLIIGVNIEYIDSSDSVQSRWFILRGTRLADVHWADQNKETGRIRIIPRSALQVNGERIKGSELLNRNTGIPQVLRALGIRTDIRKYQSKLTKMMAFNPESNINRFIQESVLDENPVNSLEEIRQYREQFTKIKQQYDDMLTQRKQLEDLEIQTQVYEKQANSLRIHELMLTYQNVMEQKEKRKELISKIRSETMRQTTLEKGSDSINRRLQQAQERLADAKNNTIMMNVQGTLNSLGNQKNNLQRDYDDASDRNSEVEKLQKKIKDTLSWLPDIPVADQNILRSLSSTSFSTEDKITAFQHYKEFVDKEKDILAQERTHLGDQINQKKTERDDLYHQKALLESNQIIYDDRAEEAKKLIIAELRKQGIETDVFLFAELVKDIKDPKWRQAIETFLGNKRFYIITEGKYVKDVLKIINDKNIYWAHAVITDRLPEDLDEIKPDSAASQLVISNVYACRYANYLLNGIHLCQTIDELHDYPLGGLMQNGMLAKSYAATKMDMHKTRICLGKDAIDIQKKENGKKIQKVNSELQELSEKQEPVQEHWHALNDMNLSAESYQFDASSTMKSISAQIADIKASINQIKKNPEFQAALQEQEDAQKAYNQVMDEHTEQIQKITQCRTKISDLKEQRAELEKELEQSEQKYQNNLTATPELEDAMINEYKRLTERTKSVIAIQESTVIRQRNSINNEIIPKMKNMQMKYLQLLGRVNEYETMTGPSRIPYYREEYRNLKNIKIDEARQQLEEKSQQLESAFMNDFVAELNEKIVQAKKEIDAINRELRITPFGLDTYHFEMKPRSDRSSFFAITQKLNEYMDSPEMMLAQEAGNQQLDHDIQEFMNMILNDENSEEYTDYRTYFNYDMKITSHQGDDNIEAELSRKQGSASGGEKQTPYFIILAASLMQCYPRELCCERLAFIDEAFSALSRERIEQMVKYLEDNHFQVIYAAPPEKIDSIGSHIDTTVSLVTKGRYSFAIEGMRI